MSRWHCLNCGDYCFGEYGYCSDECELEDTPPDER